MGVINHPGKRINDLIEANYKLRRELTVTRQHLSSVQHRYDLAQKELSIKNYSISAIPPIPMTKQVQQWISEYGVPWESLYCTECRSWFSELDSAFPYHLGSSVCKCNQDGGGNG